ncbi:hypothetical protein WJ438_20160 [Streptomyces sp. GD-15H]|uniref:hypothetical protein n=1 Tax=Streptomyces sp. GD-15H TaxID=3129112 RepID=UPI00324F465E
MLHTVLRRRANGESVEQIRPDLWIATGKRKGQNPSLTSIYRALAEHAKRETPHLGRLSQVGNAAAPNKIKRHLRCDRTRRW